MSLIRIDAILSCVMFTSSSLSAVDMSEMGAAGTASQTHSSQKAMLTLCDTIHGIREPLQRMCIPINMHECTHLHAFMCVWHCTIFWFTFFCDMFVWLMKEIFITSYWKFN